MRLLTNPLPPFSLNSRPFVIITSRPVTLFTGQWADLPLAKLAPAAKECDARGGWDFRSVGRGGVNFEENIRALNGIGHSGPLSVEQKDVGMEHFRGGKESCAFVKSIDFQPSNLAFDAAFERKEK